MTNLFTDLEFDRLQKLSEDDLANIRGSIMYHIEKHNDRGTIEYHKKVIINGYCGCGALITNAYGCIECCKRETW